MLLLLLMLMLELLAERIAPQRLELVRLHQKLVIELAIVHSILVEVPSTMETSRRVDVKTTVMVRKKKKKEKGKEIE